MAFHFQKTSTVSRSWIPVFYSVAMGVSGIGSLLFGRLFDRVGVKVLLPLTAITTLSAPHCGALEWESINRSFPQPSRRWCRPNGLPPPMACSQRPTDFSGFLGSALSGVLYDISINAVIVFSVAAELAAIPLCVKAGRAIPRHER